MGNAYIVDACRTPRGIGKVGKAHSRTYIPLTWVDRACRDGGAQ